MPIKSPLAANRRTAFFLTTSMLASVLCALPAQAEDIAPAEAAAPNDTDGEIVVQGIRRSLVEALQVKRNADSIVDGISAEDVGKFPDTNIAESVQRITGVQINRTRGEGRTVNIRGLPANFTLATLNGRTLPNAFSLSSSRSFDFAILPPEFVRTLEVYKSPVADIDDGGLSGTINIKTPRALDIGKRTFAASLEGHNESNSGKWTPRASVFYADTFADGKIGLTLGGSYTARSPETHEVNVGYTTTTEGSGIPAGGGGDDLNGNGVIEPNLQVRIPGQIAQNIYQEDRKRYSVMGSLEFAPADGLKFTIDGFYSKVTVQSMKNENLHFFNNATDVIASKVEVLEGVQTVTDFTVNNVDLRNGGRYEDRSSFVWSTVAGASYEHDNWLFSAEGSYARSRQTLDNLNIADIANGTARFTAEPGATLGNVTYLNGFDQARLDPNSYRLASLNGLFGQLSADTLWDAKFDIKRSFDDGFITSVRIGGKYTSRKQFQDNRQLTISAQGVSNLYGGLPAGPTPGTLSAAPFMRPISPGAGSFLGSYSGNEIFPTQWLGSDVRAFASQFSDAQLIAAGTYTNDATGIIDVQEKILAGYARADFKSGRFSGNIGLRAVQTRQSTVGAAPDLYGITVETESGNFTRVPSAGALAVKRSYWDFLPSFNLKFDATRDLVLRFAASRTIARPNLMDISPTTTANGNQRTITQNNPYLDPFRASNLDFTAEWYFSKDGVIGGSLFYKKLESLIRRETTVLTLPVTFIRTNNNSTTTPVDFQNSQLVNGSGVSVKGLEVYYQQAFTSLPAPFNGLGTQLNYTYIDNSDPTQLTAASRHNFNATGYYEKGRIGVRLSYSWRDGFLSSVATAPAMSQRTKAFGTLDGSINFKINDYASVVLEAVNITDNDEVVAYTTALPANYVDAGRRLLIGGRVKF